MIERARHALGATAAWYLGRQASSWPKLLVSLVCPHDPLLFVYSLHLQQRRHAPHLNTWTMRLTGLILLGCLCRNYGVRVHGCHAWSPGTARRAVLALRSDICLPLWPSFEDACPPEEAEAALASCAADLAPTVAADMQSAFLLGEVALSVICVCLCGHKCEAS